MIAKSLILSLCLMLGQLHAQTASYSSFGSGCPGTGKGTCLSSNPQGGQPVPFLNIRIVQYALPAQSPKPLVVSGFELLTRSLNRTRPVTLATQIYRQSSTNRGPGQTPAATGTMAAGTTRAWYRTSFTRPLVMKPNEVFFLSYLETSSSRVVPPRLQKGSTSSFWQRSGGQGPWISPRVVAPWAWKVNCVGGGAIPKLSNRGLPSMGKTFNIDLSGARATTGAVLNFGASKTQWGTFRLPLDLTPLGAPGCLLRASPDIMLGTGTDNAGQASVLVPVPSSAFFAGKQFHNQWMVIDPSVNPLKLVFSNGGTGVIGR